MTAPAERVVEPGASQLGDVSPAMRLQILTAEHASLVQSRNLAWNEAFTRTGMFLSTLSFAMVAVALVAQASGFGEPFRLFALAVLPVLLFLGIGTQLRLNSSSYHDVFCIVGMNRIRAMYVRLAPDLEPIFVTGTADDEAGIERTMALFPGEGYVSSFIAASPVQVAVLNAGLFATIVGLLVIQLGIAAPIGLLVGGLGFLAGIGGFAWYSKRLLKRVAGSHQPLVPGGPVAVDPRGQH